MIDWREVRKHVLASNKLLAQYITDRIKTQLRHIVERLGGL
jgi:hypothetical protein